MRSSAMNLRAFIRLGALLAALGLSAMVSDAAPAPSREITFVDERSGASLTLQVEPLARDAGHFVLRVPGRGLYEGVARNAMRVQSPTSVIVHFSGPATLGPLLTNGGQASGSVATTTVVPVELQVQADPAHLTAQASLSALGERVHLVAKAIPPGDLPQTLRAFEAATLAADWPALYGLMNTDVQAASTANAFAATMSAQVASVGRVVRLARRTVGDPQPSELGGIFAVVGYDATFARPSGTTDAARSEVYFVRQLGSWRIWYTQEH